jgi:hypothetical protein
VTTREFERAGKPEPSASAERDATALEGAVPPGFIRTGRSPRANALFRQVDEAVLDHRHLGMQTPDLVAVWLIARHMRQVRLNKVRDELGSPRPFERVSVSWWIPPMDPMARRLPYRTLQIFF